jgi:hypothetical protein
MSDRPALAALIGAMDVPPKEAMKLLTDYRAEVARELSEGLLLPARQYALLRSERMQGIADGLRMGAKLIDPEVLNGGG